MQQEMVQHRRQSFLKSDVGRESSVTVCSVMTLEALVLPLR